MFIIENQYILILACLGFSGLLSGLEIKSKENIEDAAKNIIAKGAKAVLIKGGGLQDMKGKDFFLDKNGRREWFFNKVINTKNNHGIIKQIFLS